MSFLRAVARTAITGAGDAVRRLRSPGATHIAPRGADPVTFEYVVDRRGHAVFQIPLEDARAFRALGLRLRADCHPFVRAARVARAEEDSGRAREATTGVLRSYYEAVCPASITEVFGISLNDLPGLNGRGLEGQTVDFSFLPWTGQSLEQTKEIRRKLTRLEGLRNGILLKVEDGITTLGPVKAPKLQLEVDRLSRLVASVKARGFTGFDPRSPLKVIAFRRAGEYRWVVHSGHHRFSVAAAFGVDTVQALVTQIVRREDAPYWPQVVSGFFTASGAEAIFDRMFDGIPAPACENWIRSLAGEEASAAIPPQPPEAFGRAESRRR